MAELVPPDEIYVPFQEAIDNYMIADLGVFTGEVKYLRATPKRKTADAMYAVLDLVIQEVHNTGNISTDTIEVMADTLALADGVEENDDYNR